MRAKGAIPYAYTADLGQYDEPDLERRARPGQAVRRRAGPDRRLPAGAGPRGTDGPAVRRLPHLHGRQDVLQHDAARPGRDRHVARAGDARRRRRHLGRREHLQGQRHRALLSLRAARQPGAADLQAVARRRLRRRARRAGGDERLPAGARAAVPRSHREGLLDGRQHLGGDARGQVARGACDDDGDRHPDHGRRPLGSARRDRHRGRVDHVRRRLAGGDRRRAARPGRPRPAGQRDRRTSRPGDERPDREPDHRGQEPGDLRGARLGAAAHRLRATRHGDPQRGHRSTTTARWAVASAGCCTRGGGSTRRA